MFLQSKNSNINNMIAATNNKVADFLFETANNTITITDENIDGVKMDTVADDLWLVSIEQCKMQLNMNVSEEDLKMLFHVR